MSKLFVISLAALVIPWLGCEGRADTQPNNASPQVAAESHSALSDAIASHRSGVHVAGRGIISKVLSDDNNGSRHQRLIVRLESGATVLLAHNIDVASRIPSPRVGGEVTFSGDYEWNDKGGVVHWTHRDPARRHPPGWIRYGGQLFQ